MRRGALGHWDEADRGHDALETILAQNEIRVPELVPIRHHRMAVSPWNYYRGAAAVMAADLASQPDSGLTVQLGGDAHVLNFGLWATPERNLAFDLRDFDETLPGPFEWDVKRFAASLVVAARQNGLEPANGRRGGHRGPRRLPRRMRRYRDHARARHLVRRHPRRQPDRVLRAGRPRPGVRLHRDASASAGPAAGRSPSSPRWRTGGRGSPRTRRSGSTISDDEQADITGELLAGYRQTLQDDRRSLFDRFTLADVVRQVVGVGSVGMRVYLVLLEGRTGATRCSCRSSRPGPPSTRPTPGPARHPNHGARVIAASG